MSNPDKQPKSEAPQERCRNCGNLIALDHDGMWIHPESGTSWCPETQAEPVEREEYEKGSREARLEEALNSAKTTFFYVSNLSHDAWRDPANLEAVCKRIEAYAIMQYDLLAAVLTERREDGEK